MPSGHPQHGAIVPNPFHNGPARPDLCPDSPDQRLFLEGHTPLLYLRRRKSQRERRASSPGGGGPRALRFPLVICPDGRLPLPCLGNHPRGSIRLTGGNQVCYGVLADSEDIWPDQMLQHEPVAALFGFRLTWFRLVGVKSHPFPMRLVESGFRAWARLYRSGRSPKGKLSSE